MCPIIADGLQLEGLKIESEGITMSIERRIERLESYEGAKIPEKLITLLSKLRGFKLKYDLGPDPTREEVEAAIRRMNTRLSRGT